MIATGPEAASGTPRSLPPSECCRDTRRRIAGSHVRSVEATESLQRSIRDQPVVATTPRRGAARPCSAAHRSGPGTACRRNCLCRLRSHDRFSGPPSRTQSVPTARTDQRDVRQAFALGGRAPVGRPGLSAIGLALRSGRSHGFQSGVQQPRRRLRIARPNPRPLPHPAHDHVRTLASRRTVRGIPQQMRAPSADGLIGPLSEAHPTEVSSAIRPSPGRIGTGVSDCFRRGESRSPEGRRRWKSQPRRGDRRDGTPRIETNVRRQGEARRVPCSGKATRGAARRPGPAAP